MWAGKVKHPGAHKSEMESLPPGLKKEREGILLMNLERAVPMRAGQPRGTVAFSEDAKSTGEEVL